MITYDHKGTPIIITEEYFGSFNKVRKLSFKNKCITVGSFFNSNQIGVAVFDKAGKIVGSRLKRRLTKTEVLNGKQITDYPVNVFIVDGIRILPIVCYELLYPKDYLHHKNVDLITHHSYSNMFDLCQFEGWRAMHHTLAVHFNCPIVIVSQGEDNPMKVDGIITPDSPSTPFLHERFDPYRKI